MSPYGYLLLAAAHPDRVADRMLGDLGIAEPDEQRRQHRPLQAAAASHPAQQAYVLLVMSSDATVVNEMPQQRAALHARLNAHATAPVGPQSLPLADYLGFSDLLVGLNRERRLSGDVPARIVDTLGIRMGRGYAESIRQAQINRYLWNELQSPVDIVDLDVLCMTILADTAMKARGMSLRGALDERAAEPSLAMLPMYVGLALHEPPPRQLVRMPT